MNVKKNNIGTPPGTLFYTGESKSEKVKITLIEYNDDEFFEKEYYDLSECLSRVKPGLVKWINIDGLHQLDIIEGIGKAYNIHPLILADIVNVEQRAKFEDNDSYIVTIMKMVTYNEVIKSEHLSVLLLEDTVISFQEPHSGDAFDIIRNRIRQGKGRIRKEKSDYLAYALIDAVVDWYFHAIEKIGDRIEVIEEEMIKTSDKKSLLELYDLKREMINLRKQVWPMRDMISNLARSETKLINPSTDIYLRDLQDHITRIIDTVETYRDLLSGVMDVYLSTNANRMNEVMKILTIMSSIFIPVTFVAGVYGMNFPDMPEIHSPYGYAIVWGIMGGMMIGMFIYFRKKKWL